MKRECRYWDSSGRGGSMNFQTAGRDRNFPENPPRPWHFPIDGDPSEFTCGGFAGVPGSPASHEGQDFIPRDQGKDFKILAAEAGEVVYVCLGCKQSSVRGRNTSNRRCGNLWGNHVVLKHSDGVFTRYAHLKPDTVAVRVGDTVSRGEVLAEMGNTGLSERRHLHFELGSSAGFDPCKEPQNMREVYDPARVVDGCGQLEKSGVLSPREISSQDDSGVELFASTLTSGALVLGRVDSDEIASFSTPSFFSPVLLHLQGRPHPRSARLLLEWEDEDLQIQTTELEHSDSQLMSIVKGHSFTISSQGGQWNLVYSIFSRASR